MKTITKLWIFMVILMILTPLGLLIPAYFKANTAWGEWGAGELKRLVGYIPVGLEKMSSLWKAPMAGYAPLQHVTIGYVISAAVGIVITAGIVYGIGKFLSRKD